MFNLAQPQGSWTFECSVLGSCLICKTHLLDSCAAGPWELSHPLSEVLLSHSLNRDLQYLTSNIQFWKHLSLIFFFPAGCFISYFGCPLWQCLFHSEELFSIWTDADKPLTSVLLLWPWIWDESRLWHVIVYVNNSYSIFSSSEKYNLIEMCIIYAF